MIKMMTLSHKEILKMEHREKYKISHKMELKNNLKMTHIKMIRLNKEMTLK